LSDATVKAMGRINVLLVPVGGIFSIDGRQAKQIMTRLQPSPNYSRRGLNLVVSVD
jgi:hypothetical protein